MAKEQRLSRLKRDGKLPKWAYEEDPWVREWLELGELEAAPTKWEILETFINQEIRLYAPNNPGVAARWALDPRPYRPHITGRNVAAPGPVFPTSYRLGVIESVFRYGRGITSPLSLLRDLWASLHLRFYIAFISGNSPDRMAGSIDTWNAYSSALVYRAEIDLERRFQTPPGSDACRQCP